jgi:RNA polymerase sigma-70 factor (ECF subfamily)
MKDLKLIKKGCTITFESIYNAYSDRIYSYVFRQCRSESIADEVVQHVFVRLWEKRSLLSLEHTLESQLFRMAKTIYIDELRKAAHRRRYLESQQLNQYLESIEEKIEYKNELELVLSLIDDMPPKRKQVFLMNRVENFSYLEISKKLSISPRTVENHIALALKHLRRFISIFLTLIINNF